MAFIEGTPTVVLELDKPRTLGFTMGAMRRIKEKLGTLDIPHGTDGKIPLDRAIELAPVWIWACLDAPDRQEITVEQLEEMLHPGNISLVTSAIVGLFQRSNPEAAAGATGDPTPAGPRLEASA